MAAHALLSPSGAAAWMACPGKIAMEKGEPDQAGTYADEGTAAHFLASECLTHHVHPSTVLCKSIAIDAEGVAYFPQVVGNEGRAARSTFEVDVDMVAAVGEYIRHIHRLAEGGALHVEQRVPVAQITGEQDAHGTADAVIVKGAELIVADLKYGRGVEVDATDNPQLKLYALGALEQYGLLEDFEKVRLVIIQPRVSHTPSEWTLTVPELVAWGEDAQDAAQLVWDAINSLELEAFLQPSDDACRFCRAKGKCPALRATVLTALADDFVDMDKPLAPQLGGVMDRVANCDDAHLDALFPVLDLMENFIGAVRARIEQRALAGVQFTHAKLVQGKRGNRRWVDPVAAEALLKTMRLKVEEMYDLKLISPTTAEKLAPKYGNDGKVIPGQEKTPIGPRQWLALKQHITQHDGKPTVAPITDKRPALVIQAPADAFAELIEDDLI